MKRQQGVTILEVLLVLTIAAAMIVVGLRQYQAYKLSADAELIRANADKIFQAASLYYQMQCRANRPAPAVDSNTLAPTVTDNPVVIDIQTDLVDTGLMNTPFPLNPLIDNNAAGTWKGYMVQFLRSDEPRLVCTASSPETTNPYSPNCTATEQVGIIVNWQIQVSAKVLNPQLSTQLKNITAADCRTSAAATGVKNCTEAAAFAQACSAAETIMNANPVGSGAYNAALQDYTDTGCQAGGFDNYISFQRSPSFSTDTKTQSGLWMTNKTLKEFNQMYEIQSIYQIMNSNPTPTQYFTCNN